MRLEVVVTVVDMDDIWRVLALGPVGIEDCYCQTVKYICTVWVQNTDKKIK